MATTSKSPRKILIEAHAVAAAAIPAYAHRFSPKVFTRHQVFACLVLKAALKLDYRGVAALLGDCPELRAAIGMRRAPHFTTLQKAAATLLAAEATTPLLDATVARSMGRRRRVGTVAADGTGFESRHVSAHSLKRTGREGMRTRRHTRYPKLDIVCDCATHLILSASAGQGPKPEVAGFPKLVRAAARRARITRLAADAGFDSEPNHALARDELKIRTTIPPTRGRPSQAPPTGRYRRLMKRRFNRRVYRRRWQVETVFSSMKRRQGSAARGRSYWARCRDLWLAVLTHNIMLLWRALRGFLQSKLTPFIPPFIPFLLYVQRFRHQRTQPVTRMAPPRIMPKSLRRAVQSVGGTETGVSCCETLVFAIGSPPLGTS